MATHELSPAFPRLSGLSSEDSSRNIIANLHQVHLYEVVRKCCSGRCSSVFSCLYIDEVLCQSLNRSLQVSAKDS